jgi:cell division protein FtsL
VSIMAVRARQTQIQQTYVPEQPTKQQPSQLPKKKKGLNITAGEKLLVFACVLVVVTLSVSILHMQGKIQTTSMEIQQLEAEVATVQNENVDLKVQVGELSRYDRIWKKAQELGLTLNEKNVKVVPSE